jgi:hypothetical protein
MTIISHCISINFLIDNFQIQEPIGSVQKEHNIQTQIIRAIKQTYTKQTTNTQKQNIK